MGMTVGSRRMFMSELAVLVSGSCMFFGVLMLTGFVVMSRLMMMVRSSVVVSRRLMMMFPGRVFRCLCHLDQFLLRVNR